MTSRREVQFLGGREINALVKADATLYHSDDWLSALCDFFGYQLNAAWVERNGVVQSFAPTVRISNFSGKKLSSPPASMYGHIVSSREEDQCLLLDQLRLQAKAENRRLFIKTRGHVDANSSLHLVDLEYDCRVSLASRDENWERLDGGARRAVRKSWKNGIQVREASFEELYKFLPLLAITRRRLGLPMSPRSWLKRLFSEGFMRLLLAESRGTVCAGLLFTQDENHFHYAIPAYSDEGARLRAMDATVWRLLELACEENRNFLCFGGSPGQNDGLRRFKRKWGGEETVISLWSDYPSPQRVAVKSKANGVSATIRWMPQRALESLGYIYLRYFQ